jgi:hypothetical protein
MYSVQIAPDAESVALASILAEVLEANLDRHPERIKDFNRLQGNVAILASDADVALTIAFSRDESVFHGGLDDVHKLLVTADTDTLLELTNLNIRYGIPWLFDGTGQSIIRKLLKRDLRVAGLLAHPFMLIRVLKVLSVV